jgi:hypothetical protein
MCASHTSFKYLAALVKVTKTITYPRDDDAEIVADDMQNLHALLL